MFVCGSLNVLIERVGYRPLRNAPKLAPLITAVGFSFILQNVGLLWIGGSPQGITDLIRGNDVVFSISGVAIHRRDVLAIGVTVPLVILLTWYVGRTRMGRAMRATAQDPEAARLMGINVDTTISLTFMIGGALAGAAGLSTPCTRPPSLRPGVRGGSDRVHRRGHGRNRKHPRGGARRPDHRRDPADLRHSRSPPFGPQWTPVVVFGYLIVIMVLRPRGLLGEETREAG